MTDDVDLTKFSDNKLTKLRRDDIGFIFQSFNLVPTFTAKENIELPSRIAGKKIDQAWYQEITQCLGLTERLNHRPSELSVGQQQRVACARALLGKPKIIFGDEPTGNLDSQASNEVLHILRTTVDKDNQIVVIVTHDPNAAVYADRVLFLVDGKIVEEHSHPTLETIMTVMAGIE